MKCDAIKKIVHHYDPYSETEISLAEWIAIGKQINDKESRAVYDEANDWVQQVFEKYDCFTILGL